MKIGIIGGGQLGRMLALAAYPLGVLPVFYEQTADTCAGQVGPVVSGRFDDHEALATFAESVDVVTFDWENVPVDSVRPLSGHSRVAPPALALEQSQDRLVEKNLFTRLKIPTPGYAAVDSRADLDRAIARLGLPGVLKTRRFGYDGKGQTLIREGSNISALHRGLGAGPMILEGFVPFEREVSVIAARSLEGAVVAWDLCENEHERHILARTRVPARVEPELEPAARKMAASILHALDYVGVIGVELFVVRNHEGTERLVVNEIAPRVHNSGHWTIEGAQTSQFEQHMRAIAGWSLGSTARRGDIDMHNLIGEDADDWRDILAQPDLSLHLYGKLETRPGRKMGHVTRVFPDMGRKG